MLLLISRTAKTRIPTLAGQQTGQSGSDNSVCQIQKMPQTIMGAAFMEMGVIGLEPTTSAM